MKWPLKIFATIVAAFFAFSAYLFFDFLYACRQKLPKHPIHEAAAHGDLKTAQALLEQNPALINLREWKGVTPLHRASKEDSVQMVELLLSKGANPNEKDDAGFTPLLVAVSRGRIGENRRLEIAQTLLSHKADINYFYRSGCSILHEAVRAGDPEMVELLLRNGANVNAGTRSFSPLHLAVARDDPGHQEAVKILLSHGADVNAKTEYGYTPLDIAIRHGYKNLWTLLLPRSGDLDIHEASAVGDVARVRALLDENIKLVDCGKRSAWETPLRWAVRNNQKEVVELLLNRGASADGSEATGTPLMEAAENGYWDIVRLLLDRGANINADDGSGYTTLHKAVRRGRYDVVALLLERGANANARGKCGVTPLEYAPDNYRAEMAKLFRRYAKEK